MSSTSSSGKKARTDIVEEECDFAKVREYLLRCPVVGGGDTSKNPAIVAALAGLDAELQRRRRDAKLHDKFMNTAVAVEKPAATVAMTTETLETEQGRAPKVNNNTNDNMDESDDWQDISQEEENANTDNNTSSALAKQVIALLAQHDPDVTRVHSPLAAIAVALHAALLSLDFKCTGLPENNSNNNSSGGGFAPPVRELPASKFLPDRWETNNGAGIALRYRKNESGSVVLQVRTQPNDENTIEVNLQQAKKNNDNSMPDESSLVLKLGDYVNLESFGRAAKNSSGPGVSPALHYKSLSNLLARFASTFDLGGCGGEGGAVVATNPTIEQQQQQLPYVDTTVRAVQQHQPQPPLGVGVGGEGNVHVPPLPQNQPYPFNPRDETKPPLIDEEFPTRPLHNMPGDFTDDLLPTGIPSSIGGGLGGSRPPAHMGGNLMGPNHPIFQGGGVSGSGISGGVGPGSGFGMRPKFDPFGPPGGPTEIDQDPNKPRIPPGGTGNPNRDDMSKPNDFHDNNNMFM